MLPADPGLPGRPANLPEPSSGAPPAFDPAPRTLPPLGLAGPSWRCEVALPPPSLSSGLDTVALFQAFQRRWLLALSLGLVIAAAAGAGAWFLFANKYTAFAQLRIAATPPWMVVRNADTPEGRAEFLTYQRTQATQLRSRFVLSAALNREEVKKLPVVTRQADPIAWLEEEVKVDYHEGSEFLTVSMTGPNPGELLTLVNAVAKAYEKEVVEAETERRRKRLDELDRLYTEASTKLSKKKESLRQMAEDLGTSESAALTQKQVNLLTHLGEVKRQHLHTRAELMKAQVRLESHKAQEKALKEIPLPETAVNEVLETDAVAKQHLTRMARLEEIIADYERNAVRKNESSRLRAEQEVQGLQEKVQARRAEIRKSLEERQRQRARQEFDALLAQLQNEVEPWLQQEKSLRAEVENLTREAEKMGRSSTAFEMLRAEINREDRFADRIGNEAEVVRVELRSPPRVTRYQEAALQRMDMKRQLLATFVVAVGALAGICFVIAWWEARARRIRTTDEVVTGLGIRVVGAVPPLPHGDGPVPVGAVAEEDIPSHSVLESIDGIRTLLLRDARAGGLRVVMVTSAVSSEGKTTLASHLASSLARAGRRTLLIDSDLRRPTTHQLFEVAAQPGLSEVLLGEVSVGEATQATAVTGLWMMPAGQWDREVLQALARDGIQKIFARLREEYDFIVVDSHPVLLANDALLIGLHADAVLLSLLRDVSQMPRVYAAWQRLASLNIRVLGAVVNGMPEADLYGQGYCRNVVQPVHG